MSILKVVKNKNKSHQIILENYAVLQCDYSMDVANEGNMKTDNNFPHAKKFIHVSNFKLIHFAYRNLYRFAKK